MRIVSHPKKPFTPKTPEKPKPFLQLSPIQTEESHGQEKPKSLQC